MANKELPVVPPRNDPNPLEPYAKSQALQISNARPGFVQQWVKADEVHKYTRRQEIGDPSTGYLMVEPWQVVDRTSGYEQGRKRDDASEGVDTVITNGELILIETTEENHKKFAIIEAKRDEQIDKRLAQGEKSQRSGVTAKQRSMGGRDGMHAQVKDVLAGV